MYYEFITQVYTNKEEAIEIHDDVIDFLKDMYPNKTASSVLITTKRDEKKSRWKRLRRYKRRVRK